MYEPPENRYVLRDLYSQQQAVTRLTLVLTIAPNWLGEGVPESPQRARARLARLRPYFSGRGQGGASASVSRIAGLRVRRRLLSNPSESHVVGGHGVLSAAESNFLTSCSLASNPNGVSESGPVHQNARTLRERRLGNRLLCTR
jgi:hypothetical protein